MGIVDHRHRHLQTCGGVLLAAAHLDQSDKVQVMKAITMLFTKSSLTHRCWRSRDEELDSRSGREQFVELDSLDTEKALLLTDDDDDDEDDPS